MESSFNEKQWALIAHLSGFVGFIFPFGNVIGPLTVWLLKKEQSPLVEEHAREALNFQISMAIYFIIASVLIIAVITAVVGIVLLPILFILQVIFMIKAALEADKGRFYLYPMTFRLVKN